MLSESAVTTPLAPKFSTTDQRALAAVAMQFFLNGAVFASFMPRLPEIRGRIGTTTGGLGLMLSIAGIIGIAGSALVGPAIEKFGTWRVVMLGGTILGGSLPLIGVANGKAVFLIGLVLMMTFDVFVDVAMNMQASWLSARRHAPVINRLHGLAGFVFVGLGASTLLPRLYDLAAKHPDRPGAGLAFLTGGIRVAAVASPFLVGALANSSLSVGHAIAIISIPAVVGFYFVAMAIRNTTNPN